MRSNLNRLVLVNLQHNNQKNIEMKIAIGNDHAGPDYKKAIVSMLESKGHTIFNHGTDTFDSVDYPDFGHPVANDVSEGKADFGIVICGSGNGISYDCEQTSKIESWFMLDQRNCLFNTIT